MLKLVRLILICFIVFFSKSALATTITSATTSAQTLSSDNDSLSITGSGSLTVSSSAAVVGSGHDLTITVNPTSSSDGIIATGSSAAVSITGSLSSLNLNNGVISSAATSAGSIDLLDDEVTSTAINISSGTSVTNSGSGGFGIRSSTGSTNIITLTVSNAGTISIDDSVGSRAIFMGGGSSNSLTLSNTGTIRGVNGAISITNPTATITNSGTIVGNVVLGANAGTSLTLSGGTITGNVTMNNSGQSLAFNGGTVTGTINGAGNITANSNTTTDGNIGNSTSVTSLTVAAAKTFDADTNNNSISATTITLGSGSTLQMGTGALTGTVDGSAANTGTATFNLDSTSTTLSSTLGSTNGLSVLNITSTSGTTTLSNNTKAQTVNVLGTTSILSLSSSKSITGSVSIGSGNTLTLNNGSSVSGDIKGASNGVGITTLASSATVSGAGDFGTSSLGLSSLSLGSSSALTMASSKVINATTITLGSSSSLTASSYITGNTTMNTSSTLNLNDGAYLTGTIDGSSSNLGTINTSGSVTSLGQIGNSYAVSAINVASGSVASFENSDSSNANVIKANDINVTGRINLLDATTITGNVTMLGSSSKISTGGYSQSISGSFTTASGSQIIATVHSASSADLITVAGVASLDSNTKLYVNLTATSGGASYTILSGGSSSSISAISDANISINGNGTNTSGSYTFHTSVSGNSLILSVESTSPTFSDSSSQAIYNTISNATGTLLTFQNYLNSASTTEADATAKTAAPQTDNSSNRNAMSVTTASLSTVDTRIAEVFNNDSAQFAAAKESDVKKKLGLTASDVFAQEDKEEKTRGMWVKAFGSSASQSNAKTGGQGFKSNSGGFAFGADKKIDDNTVVGLSFSFANSRINSSDSLKKTYVDTYQLNLYGGKTFGDYYTNAILGYAFNHYTSSRLIPSASTQAGAKYNGQTYVGMIKGGRNFALDQKFRLSPELTVTAANNNVNNYNESGAGTMSLRVRNSSANFFETRAGVVFDYTTLTANKTKLRPALKLSYGYDWVGAKQNNTANFVDQSSSFASQGSKVSRRSIKMGAGLDVFRVDEITFGLEYTYEYRFNYIAHSGSLQGRYNF